MTFQDLTQGEDVSTAFDVFGVYGARALTAEPQL